MKNTRRIICILVTICLMNVSAFAMNIETAVQEQTVVQPRFTYISSISVGLGIDLDGRSVSDTGVTLHESIHDGRIDMKLQRYKNNAWQDVKSWSVTDDGPNIDIEGIWYVTPGFDYRVESTVRVYNANGRIIEMTTEYSPIVEY